MLAVQMLLDDHRRGQALRRPWPCEETTHLLMHSAEYLWTALSITQRAESVSVAHLADLPGTSGKAMLTVCYAGHAGCVLASDFVKVCTTWQRLSDTQTCTNRWKVDRVSSPP